MMRNAIYCILLCSIFLVGLTGCSCWGSNQNSDACIFEGAVVASPLLVALSPVVGLGVAGEAVFRRGPDFILTEKIQGVVSQIGSYDVPDIYALKLVWADNRFNLFSQQSGKNGFHAAWNASGQTIVPPYFEPSGLWESYTYEGYLQWSALQGHHTVLSLTNYETGASKALSAPDCRSGANFDPAYKYTACETGNPKHPMLEVGKLDGSQPIVRVAVPCDVSRLSLLAGGTPIVMCQVGTSFWMYPANTWQKIDGGQQVTDVVGFPDSTLAAVVERNHAKPGTNDVSVLDTDTQRSLLTVPDAKSFTTGEKGSYVAFWNDSELVIFRVKGTYFVEVGRISPGIHYPIQAVAFSEDETMLAVANSKRLALYQIAPMSPAKPLAPGAVSAE